MASISKMKQIKSIKQAIKTKNIITLKELAIKHGLLSDKLRKKAWPLILGIDPVEKRQKATNENNESVINAVEYHHIEQDIKRTPLYYYDERQRVKQRARTSLSKILHGVFDGDDHIEYIQGFHDVTSVLYAVCNNIQLTQKISIKVAETLLCDFIVRNKLNDSENATIDVAAYKLITDVIELYDNTLTTLVTDDDFVAVSISWLITWFAHQINDIHTIARIYDYCLCSDKCISSYLCAALIIYLKDDLLLATDDGNITLFEYFAALEWNQIDFNQIIQTSQLLYDKYDKLHNNEDDDDICTVNVVDVNNVDDDARDIWSLGLVVLSKM